MRKNLAFAGALAICVLAAALVIGTGKAPAVHAQTKDCDATSLTGAYGYSLTGTVYDSQYNWYLLGAAGRLVSDGSGSLTGADTFSFDGDIVKRQYTGTYTMNADCTGSMTLTPPSGAASHFDFVAVNNSKEVNVVQTDTDWILTGVLKLQNQ
jgi:hypothetical protein